MRGIQANKTLQTTKEVLEVTNIHYYYSTTKCLLVHKVDKKINA